MHIEQLKLLNFKNYKAETFHFSPNINCLVGLNGMGKTNVLDAIYYACMSKSYFNMLDSHVVNLEETFFRLEMSIENEDRKDKLVVKMQPKKLKEFEVNGSKYEKITEHIGRFPVVMISPEDTLLATEGSEARRKLMDNTLSQLSHEYLMALIQYNGILKQRAAALKLMYQSQQYNQGLIDVYNVQLIDPATIIHQKRVDFISELTPVFYAFYALISGEKEQVKLEFLSDMNDETLEHLLEKNKEKDRILQRTSAGLHRDDISFVIDENQLKRFASQGQTKSFVLALKLSQYELLRRAKGIKPFLLLDDIFDKLDPQRVSFLIDLLLQKDFGQIFMTDAHKNRISDILVEKNASFQVFEIENAKILVG
jgi:DNA replication and repair protein RecF